MKAFVYTRVSMPDPEDSLEIQLDACNGRAIEIGADVVHAFADFGSGDSLLGGMIAMLASLEDSDIDCVVVLNRSRFSNNPMLVNLYCDYIEKLGVAIEEAE